jgi:hypothetical protein
MIWWRKHNSASDKVLARRTGEILCSRGALGNGQVARGPNELGELSVGDVGYVHVEAIDINAVNGARIKRGCHPHIVHIGRIIRSHGIFSSRDPDHSFWRRSRRPLAILNGRLKPAG